jgi:hypothetical protein
VREENQVAREVDAHPFAGGIYTLDRAACQWRVRVYPRELWKLRFKLGHYLSSQGSIQCSSRTKYRVAFRHLAPS